MSRMDGSRIARTVLMLWRPMLADLMGKLFQPVR